MAADIHAANIMLPLTTNPDGGPFGVLWGSFGDEVGTKWDQVGTKWGPTETKWGPSGDQVGTPSERILKRILRWF